MIIRAWKARTARSKFDTYARHFRETVVPELGNIPGHVGAYLLRRSAGTHVEVLVLTIWESMEAVAAFAGKRTGKAVVAPAAQALLESFDTTVEHYEVAFSSMRGPI